MTIVPYEAQKHEEKIRHWLKDHRGNEDRTDLSDLPELGFVVKHWGLMVACAFIRRVEGGYGLVDGMTRCTDMPKPITNRALNFLTEHLVKVAKREGLKALICFSVNKKLIERAQSFGFTEGKGQVTLCLPLEK